MSPHTPGSTPRTLCPLCRDLGTEFLTCDCRLRWLLSWARNHSLQLSERTLCAYPKALHAQALSGLQEAQLRCGEQTRIVHPLRTPPGPDSLLRDPAGSRLSLLTRHWVGGMFSGHPSPQIPPGMVPHWLFKTGFGTAGALCVHVS